MQFSDQNATTDPQNEEREYSSWLYFRGNTLILHFEISVQIKQNEILELLVMNYIQKYAHITEAGQCIAISKNGTSFEMGKLDCKTNAYFICQIGK